MKKILFILSVVIGVTAVSAEMSPNAIGLRFGAGNAGGGADLTYQRAMGSANRLELDLGWYGALSVAGIYQWNWNIVNGLNWYAGPGLSVYVGDVFGLAAGGQIGIEYNFNTNNVPILLSLDAMPMYNVLNGGGFGWGSCLSVRYTF